MDDTRSFQTAKMDEITDFVRHRFFHRYIKKIACTGGGAYKVRKSAMRRRTNDMSSRPAAVLASV